MLPDMSHVPRYEFLSILNIYNLICFIYVYQFDILFYSFLLLKKREKASHKKNIFLILFYKGL